MTMTKALKKKVHLQLCLLFIIHLKHNFKLLLKDDISFKVLIVLIIYVGLTFFIKLLIECHEYV